MLPQYFVQFDPFAFVERNLGLTLVQSDFRCLGIELRRAVKEIKIAIELDRYRLETAIALGGHSDL